MEMKILYFVSFFLAVLSVTSASNSEWVIATDEIIFYDPAFHAPVPKAYSTVEVKFPPRGRTNNRTITAVKIHDFYDNDKGAMANLVNGGPGFKYAVLNFTSRYGEGIYSYVEIRAAKQSSKN